MTPSSARYDVQSSLFGRAVDAANDANKAETPGSGKGDDKTSAAVDDGGEKRGKKRAAAPRTEGAVGDDAEGSPEEGSEEGSEEGFEEGDSEDDSEGSGDEGGEVEEEEEEGVDQAHYHALCKKPDNEPLKEPRFGLCFWNDAVPLEVRYVRDASRGETRFCCSTRRMGEQEESLHGLVCWRCGRLSSSRARGRYQPQVLLSLSPD